MRISKGKVVSIQYALKDTTGEVLESSEEELSHGHVHGPLLHAQ